MEHYPESVIDNFPLTKAFKDEWLGYGFRRWFLHRFNNSRNLSHFYQHFQNEDTP